MEKEIFNTYCVTPKDFELDEDDYENMWDILNGRFEDLFDYESDNKQYVITGSLGLWYGRRGVYSDIVFDSIGEAIRECWNDCEDIIVYDKKGHLIVEALHHDGRNIFEIKELTKKGEDMMDNWYDSDICKVKYATKKIKFWWNHFY